MLFPFYWAEVCVTVAVLGCWTSQQRAKCSSGTNFLTQHAATLTDNLLIKLAISPHYRALTPGWPVLALTL